MRSTPPRLTNRSLVVLAFIALITFISLSDNHAPSSLPRSALSFAKQRLPGFGEIGNPGRRWGGSDDGTCFAWDPHGLEEDDPPDCLRARQFRQVQKVRKANPHFDSVNRLELDRLEKCVMGAIECPPRPLIVVDWWYALRGLEGGHSGEEIWMAWVGMAVRDEGFVYIPTEHEKADFLVRELSESVHMYWLQDYKMVKCATNPRCVRPEDFTPHPDPEVGHKMHQLAKGEHGKLPLWRLFAATYWGARPLNAGGPGQNSMIDWGVTDNWSYSPLGTKWVITPFSYEGHSYLPYSMERECLQNPVIPYSERNDSILILAKRSVYFHWTDLNDVMSDSWPSLVADMKSDGYEFWTTAEAEEGFPIPEGLKKMGLMTRSNYEAMIGSAKVLLGIGKPEISPSVYTAFPSPLRFARCRGLPLVMPYMGDTPTPEGWQLYNRHQTQHGPANTIGEPWVYTYQIDDMEDLKAKIRKAMTTPIKPYVPPAMTEVGARERLRSLLYHDWEGEYKRIVAANGGS
ncbi:hypothetical protein EHS25_000988 [Saitozyma podzolica]|uniref:Glycosyltransferase family 18 catalytic domain-containing protein n=1 Tax=Saitozyma podzolica TaxID=1890683 RepID=A0A427YH90_9TREE|nr:hypothetical protein EHS25_000988 [Saitozyma podzolica]